MRVHGHLAFIHGFEQCRLGLGRGAIDLVGQHDVGKNRSALELKPLLVRGVNRNSQHIGRQHVAGELNALKRTVQSASHGMGQRRLAHSRNSLNE